MGTGDATSRRQAILEAAERVFADKGHHATRVQDISDEAGVAYGLVYHYFGSKDALLTTVFDENWAIFATVVEAIADSDRTPRHRMRAVLDYAFGALEAYPARLKVILVEYGRRATLGDALEHPHVRRVLGALGRTFEAAQADGHLDPDADPKVLPVLLLGALQAAIVGGLAGHPSVTPDAVRRTVLVLFRGVVSDSPPPGGR